ncbi:MAG TPA: hypothetical protein VHK91_13505 [Flavisolibacter sp.]|jgi:hypothetical protein|nr:hypothetical protein [Flavisolibacter sp.]
MKYLLLATILFATSCASDSNSHDAMAKSQIDNYVKSRVKDPAGYEAVSYSPVKEDALIQQEDQEYLMLKDSIKKVDEQMGQILSTDFQSRDALSKLKEALQQRLAAFGADYKTGSRKGYMVVHTFRKKNAAGAMVLDSVRFRFDSSYQLIEKPDYAVVGN